jgi:transposase
MYWDNEMAEDLYDLVSPAVQQGGISVQFWGCDRARGPLVEFDGWVDVQSYLDVILKPVVAQEMKMDRDLVFEQDNARPHKGKKVIEWLGKQKFNLINWPPQSPDLSPIETIWNVMKMKLKAIKPRPRSKADISNAMHKIWLGIDDDTRQKCCDKFRGNLKRCSDFKGYPIFKRTRKRTSNCTYHTDIDSDYSIDDLYEE